MPNQLAFYARPEDEPVSLVLPPRLASWDRADHPSQVALRRFLDHAADVLHLPLVRERDPLALRLDVGLANRVPLLDHHDLDNYLFPLATGLSARSGRQFASVWARKRHGGPSLLRVGAAHQRAVPHHVLLVHTTRSSGSTEFKEEIHRQVRGAEPLPAGPVALEMSFVVGPRRAWPNLWKPTIDSLSPILGTSDPRPWHPQDGRIVELGLHVRVDPSIGYGIRIGIVAASAGHGTRPTEARDPRRIGRG